MSLRFYDYCPGNGTRYFLLFGELPDGSHALAWLWRNDAGGSIIRIRCPLESTYLMEKMGIENRTDTNALLGFLRMMGLTVMFDPGYTDLGMREHDQPHYALDFPPRPIDIAPITPFDNA